MKRSYIRGILHSTAYWNHWTPALLFFFIGDSYRILRTSHPSSLPHKALWPQRANTITLFIEIRICTLILYSKKKKLSQDIRSGGIHMSNNIKELHYCLLMLHFQLLSVANTVETKNRFCAASIQVAFPDLNFVLAINKTWLNPYEY